MQVKGDPGFTPGKPSLTDKIGDAMRNGTGSYEDIDNALSAGGHDGNGSPQTATVSNGPTTAKKALHGSPSGPSGGSGDSGGSGHSRHTSAKKALKYYEAPLPYAYQYRDGGKIKKIQVPNQNHHLS